MNRRSVLLLLSLGVLAVAAGALLAHLLGTGVTLQSGTWLPRPRTLAEFHLQDTSGRDFGVANLRGHPTLLFFGFTHCPDVCPTTLATLAQVQRQPPLAGAQVVFVSVDPERDTAAALESYLAAFSSGFIGLRGDRAALAPLLRTLNAIAVRDPLPGGGYTMDHSATLYLLDKHARLVAVFSPPFATDALVADLRRVEAARNL
jgi:protein SCO1/2